LIAGSNLGDSLFVVSCEPTNADISEPGDGWQAMCLQIAWTATARPSREAAVRAYAEHVNRAHPAEGVTEATPMESSQPVPTYPADETDEG
jgi:hypothetical protein